MIAIEEIGPEVTQRIEAVRRNAAAMEDGPAGTLLFETSEEGLRALAEFQRAFETGEQVTISEGVALRFDRLPPLMQPHVFDEPKDGLEITIGPSEAATPRRSPARLVAAPTLVSARSTSTSSRSNRRQARMARCRGRAAGFSQRCCPSGRRRPPYLQLQFLRRRDAAGRRPARGGDDAGGAAREAHARDPRVGTEWREYAKERTQGAHRDLLRLARLRRQRDRIVEQAGEDIYRHIE